MISIEIYEAVKMALQEEYGKLLRDTIVVQSKVDLLPDYPSYQMVGDAIGISRNRVAKYVRDEGIKTHILKDGSIHRIHKNDFVKLIIRNTEHRRQRGDNVNILKNYG